MNRKVTLVIGAQRSGKSFGVNEKIKANLKIKECSFVYNLGKPKDFDCCEYIELLNMREHEEHLIKEGGPNAIKEFIKFREFRYFKYKDKVYRIENFNTLFYGMGTKATGLDASMEGLFFHAYFKYISHCHLVFDDALPIFNANLKGWMKTLLTRVNHTGSQHVDQRYKGKGSDITIIFHSLNQVPKSILDCYQEDWIFRTFRYSEQPNYSRISNPELRSSLKASFLILQDMPQYSYTEFYKGNTILYRFENGKYKVLAMKIDKQTQK